MTTQCIARFLNRFIAEYGDYFGQRIHVVAALEEWIASGQNRNQNNTYRERDKNKYKKSQISNSTAE